MNKPINVALATGLAVVGCFGTGAAAPAQCYSVPYYGSYYPQVYYQKEYVVKKEYVPVAVPVSYPTVAVPIYSYINAGYVVPGYGYPAVSAYPASPYPPGTPGYPGYTQQQLNADQVADLVLKRLEKKLNLSQSGPPPGNQPPPGPPPAANRTAGDVSQVPALLATKCASCHSGDASSGGGFAIFNDRKQLLSLVRERRWDIFDKCYEGQMPKGGTPLTDQEVELIRLWARQRQDQRQKNEG